MKSGIICFLISLVFIIGVTTITCRKAKKAFGTDKEKIGRIMFVLMILWAIIMTGASFAYCILSYYI